ncbi:MAG TPA: hypothetical protein VF107_09920 [Burkholderiaceae bacterium]
MTFEFVAANTFSGDSKHDIGTDVAGEPRIIRVQPHKLSAVTKDGCNQLVASNVFEGSGLRAHADQRHGVQAGERRSIVEPDRAREVLRSDIAKSGLPKDSLEGSRVAKAVTTVGDGSDVPFRDDAQLVQYRKLLVRTPGADAQSATLHQGVPHLSGRGGSIREELESLLAEDDVKLFARVKRKGAGLALPPIHCGSQPSCDSEHLGIRVDADNRPCGAEALLCKPRNDPGAASDIENAVAWPESNVLEERLDPGLEERSDEDVLVHLGKGCLREATLFPGGSIGGLRWTHATRASPGS